MSSEMKGSGWQTAFILLIAIAAIGGITYAAIRLRPDGERWTGSGGAQSEGRFCASSCPDCPTNVPLPQTSPLPIPKLSKGTSPWFISTNIAPAPRISIVRNITGGAALRVDYAPYAVSTDSGVNFKANPVILNNSLPSDSAILRYSVYFPPDFPWTKGGKLPGFCISDTADGCATGSRWSNGSGSVRVMFRQEGRAIGYVYVPLQVAGASPGLDGIAAVAAAQGPEFQKVSNLPSYTLSGIDLWCKASGGLQFQAGEWNNVTLLLRLNDIGQSNGVVSLTVNEQTRQMNDMIWRIDKKVGINKLIFATFFGGNNPGWMIREPTFSLFRNFGFAAPAAETAEAPTPTATAGGLTASTNT
ncbi:hypothetical protein Ndes2526B_g06476 [Nannochloris sp. 'desiccata']|nr:hypothetical protein KSW81_008226 [Chlorella desiccata (nom. nud.)]KAH7619496.1 hypothetical protein NADE_006333 [Chlorella desiccata (nom. nud.)]